MRWSRSWWTFASPPIAYFFVGYTVAYGVDFFVARARRAGAEPMAMTLVKFFFLLTFAAAIPAIISGGIAERAKFHPAVDCHGGDRGRALSAVRRC
jgi:Amt family ammonium transporter